MRRRKRKTEVNGDLCSLFVPRLMASFFEPQESRFELDSGVDWSAARSFGSRISSFGLGGTTAESGLGHWHKYSLRLYQGQDRGQIDKQPKSSLRSRFPIEHKGVPCETRRICPIVALEAASLEKTCAMGRRAR